MVNFITILSHNQYEVLCQREIVSIVTQQTLRRHRMQVIHYAKSFIHSESLLHLYAHVHFLQNGFSKNP